MDREPSRDGRVGRKDCGRVLIAGMIGFPNGTGAAARAHAYAKGLRAAGCEVQVVCLRWSERSIEGAENRQADGVYRGVPFTYSSGSPYRPATFVRRRARDVWSALRFALLVRGGRGKPPANVILIGNYAVWIGMAVAFCRLAGTACVIEKSEYPFVYEADTPLTRVKARVYEKTVYPLVDGVIAISTYLERYFLQRVRRGARVIRIPILVDPDEFGTSTAAEPAGRKILCFVGHLDHAGEVDGLLGAFGEVAARFPEWDLRIIGGSSDPRALERFRARAADLGIGERVEFTGRVERTRLPGLLGEATAFALPRASGIFSTAGFPTKLGEYLATAKPVVVTATGDIPLYLRDGVDAYLVPPDDTQAFAARLADMFADPSAAREIGARGRETARREFDVVSQGRRLADFLAGFSASGPRRQPRGGA